MRTYQTQSGTYTEEELGVVIWMNPKNKKSKQSRFLETMTSDSSTLPMAFPLKSLIKNKNWQQAKTVKHRDEVYELISDTERSRPLIVPLPIATQALGWENFYVPSEYTL